MRGGNAFVYVGLGWAGRGWVPSLIMLSHGPLSPQSACVWCLVASVLATRLCSGSRVPSWPLTCVAGWPYPTCAPFSAVKGYILMLQTCAGQCGCHRSPGSHQGSHRLQPGPCHVCTAALALLYIVSMILSHGMPSQSSLTLLPSRTAPGHPAHGHQGTCTLPNHSWPGDASSQSSPPFSPGS